MTSPETVEFHRSEVEIAANAVWALVKAGLIPPSTPMTALVEATGITLDDLRLARVRSERVTPRRLAPTPEPTRSNVVPLRSPEAPEPRTPLPPAAYIRDPAPKRGDLQRLTEAGRKGAAESVFAMWRARGNLNCTRCGQPIDSGCDAVIEAAHHADNCCTG